MGTFVGHIANGLPMLAIGLWHIFNTARNYVHSPTKFHSRPWFPVHSKFMSKYTELYTMMAVTLISITTELFLSPARHRPWGPDGSIPLSHMNRMEHATIALSFFVYAVVALAVDKLEIAAPAGLIQAMAAAGFAQELLLFHFHSTSAVGVEKHYHWLFQAVVAVCLGSTLVEVVWPEKAVVALLRAAAVTMQGVWLLHMAFVLWIPAAIPSGCELRRSKNVFVAKCSTREATARAIAMANLYFTWDLLLVLLVTFVFLFYNSSHTVCSLDNVCKPNNKIEGYQPLDFKEYDMESLQRYCRSCSETAQSESDHDDVINEWLVERSTF